MVWQFACLRLIVSLVRNKVVEKLCTIHTTQTRRYSRVGTGGVNRALVFDLAASSIATSCYTLITGINALFIRTENDKDTIGVEFRTQDYNKKDAEKPRDAFCQS